MAEIQSIIYLSPGNLPSQMAHTGQIAKMAQAISQKIKDFELVTSGDILSAIRGMDSEFKSWYNLYCDFKLVRLPIYIKANLPFPKSYRQSYKSKIYHELAVLYACLKAPSLVYTRTPKIAALLLKIGMPVLFEWHELIDDKSTHFKFFTDKNLIGVVTLSSQLAENYMKLGLEPEKVLVAHSAVELSNFLPDREKDVARQKVSLTADKKIILYSGHLYESKGIKTILEVARLMPEYQFVLVGGWIDDINRVKKICQETDLCNVHIVGHVPQSELASYLYAADILILPTSRSWNLAEVTSPLKLFEYMAVRRPIVASALPNIMTVLSDRQNALLVESDQPLAFKQAIKELFENPSLAKNIAESAYQEVKNYTWTRRADLVLQFTTQRLHVMEDYQFNNHKNLIRYLQQIVIRAFRR